MLRLWQFEISPFCDKIRRALHWKGLAYEVREVPIAESLTAIRKVNRAGKLPTLEHDGRFVADSTDIAEYLEERFPEPPLFPRVASERALCHVLEDWADESLYYYEMHLRFTLPHNARRFVPQLLSHDAPWVQRLAGPLVRALLRRQTRAQGVGRKPLAAVVKDLERHVAAVDGLLAGAGDWLVGSALSIADLAVFAQLACIRASDEGGKAVEAHAPVTAWMERVDRATRAPRSA